MCGLCDGDEGIVPRSVPEASSPTKQEVAEHNLSHTPFRSWCPHCVFGRSMERKCASEGRVPGVIQCIHADYLYMGSSEVEGTTPILVVKDDHTESVFANVVPSKGVNEYTVKQIVEDIDSTGHTSILFKTDNEPTVLAIQEQVKSRRPHKTVLENSVRGKSKTNGFT